MTFVVDPYRFGGASLLLDESGLGSAHAAYSVARKLRDAYAGSCIRVRRSSDSTEQDIGFSNNELDQSALTTFVGANTGYITKIYDQSGNANDAAQATTTKQPIIVNSGSVVTDGGKPAMSLGTDEHLRFAGGAISAKTAVTLAVICNVGTTDVTNHLKAALVVGAASNAKSVWLSYGYYNNASYKQYPALSLYGAALADSAISTAANTDQCVLIGFAAATALSLYENDEAERADGGALSTSVDSSSVGVASSSAGTELYMRDDYWQEGVVWFSDLEASVATIKSNVNAFYGIY